MTNRPFNQILMHWMMSWYVRLRLAVQWLTFAQEILSVLPESITCHRMLSDLYSSSLDFENTIKVSESGLELVSRFQTDYGFSLHL